MPRHARLDAPGVVHHVMIRGIEQRDIFRDNKDRDNLLERLSTLLPSTETTCYGWAFLSNHAHFLFRSGPVGLSTLMRRLLTGYAIGFNRRHKRHGHLFQNRYKSIVCQEDPYLRELVRYIHLNPLRANIVSNLSDLKRLKYCGHSVLMGNRECDWQDTDYVLSYFGNREQEARMKYSSYVEDGVDQGRLPELVGGGLIRSLGGLPASKSLSLKGDERVKGDERILGDGEFVTSILSDAAEQMDRRYKLRDLGYDLERIEQKVLKLFGIVRDELHSEGRQKTRVKARSVYCYWAVRELGYTQAEVGGRLGLSQPGVGYAVQRGEGIIKEKGYCFEE